MMISQYDELKRTYKESAQKFDHLTFCDGENVETSSCQRKRNDGSPRERQQCVDNIEIDFVRELKTSQLKAVQERSLVKSFEKITKMYTDSIGFLQKSLDDVMVTNRSYEEEIKRLKHDREDQNKRENNEIDQLRYERDQIKDDLEQTKKQVELMNIEISKVTKKHESDMDNFLCKMDEEVEKVQIAMKEEAMKKMKELKSRLLHEKDLESTALHKEFCQLQTDKLRLKDQLKQNDEEFQKDVLVLRNLVANKSSELDKMQDQVQKSKEKVKLSESKQCDLQKLMEHEKKQWMDEINRHKVDRQEELCKIEQKVTNVIKAKDIKIKALQNRAMNAESRVEELERLFERIETGFINEKDQECKI